MSRSIRLACAALLLSRAAASALTIVIDYTYDASHGGDFFASNTAAKASLEAAAADLSAAITSSLAPISTDVYTGTSGSASVTFDWSLDVRNPVTGAIVEFNTFSAAADTIKIFVGMRPLSGSTLGTGGPGAGAEFGISFSGSGANLQNATLNAQAASNAAMTRGAGPVIGSINGNVGATPYTLEYGSIFGNIWFDNDTDNNGSIDSGSILDQYWNFDLAAPVSGKHDFYSVALHELLHALGIGASDTWDDLANGSEWLGLNAAALNGGTGTNLLGGDEAHIRQGLLSPRISDGVMQEVVMSPAILQGTRKYLTEMDLAFLRDLDHATIPEPSSAMLFGAGLLLGVASRRRNGTRRNTDGAGGSNH